MKILHIWDVAGVSLNIAKTMDRLYGTESMIIMRRIFDPFKFLEWGYLFDDTSKKFIIRALFLARKFDLIHIHDVDHPLFLYALRRLYPKKPIVLHYHGTSIRNRWKEKKDRLKNVNAIIVSTPDLLEGAPENVIYLPNPIDTELFKPNTKKEVGKAFHIKYDADDLAMGFARQLNLQLIMHDRKKNPIPYREMPIILSRYEYYIDVRRSEGVILKNLSKTSLEALACGCKVVRYDGMIMNGLPEEHKPENVVNKLWSVYTNLL